MAEILLPLDKNTCEKYAQYAHALSVAQDPRKELSELHEEWTKDALSFSEEDSSLIIQEIGRMADPKIEQSLPFRIHEQIVGHINQHGVAPEKVNLPGMDINLSEDDMKLYKNFDKSKAAEDPKYSGEFYKNISIAKEGKPIFDCINPDKEKFAQQQSQLQIIAIHENVRRHEAIEEARECAEELKKKSGKEGQEGILNKIKHQEKVFVGLGGSEAFFKQEMKARGVGKNSTNTQKEKEGVGPDHTPWTDTRNTPKSQSNGVRTIK